MKEEFYARLTAHMQAEVKTHPRLILCGDFNVAADDRDVPNPASAAKYVLFTPTERAWLQALQQQAGLADAFRHVSAEEHVYSWWDYRTFGRSPGNGMRIDYLFVTPPLVPHIAAVTHSAAERTKPQPSDHIPVTLTLTL
jgi:exodeoxyribonuclease-3